MATIHTNGVEMHYIREGRGEPVLLVHGYLFGADWWRPQMAALADRFDVVAPDLRGQMSSQTTDDQAGYDLWNQAEDVHGLIDALGIAPVHYVGLSVGGMIGMRLALRHPADFRSLVLMDTSAGPEDPEKAERYAAMRQVVAAGQLEAVVAALPPIFLTQDFIDGHPGEVEAWLQRLREADPMGVVRAGEAVDTRDDITGRLGEITVPTLVIHGTDDVPIPMDRAEQLAAGIPGARLETVSGGHQSNVDRPAETGGLIRDFLVRLPAAASTIGR
jgi:pimeloyl-ACP methyl ester carboxylesterase